MGGGAHLAGTGRVRAGRSRLVLGGSLGASTLSLLPLLARAPWTGAAVLAVLAAFVLAGVFYDDAHGASGRVLGLTGFGWLLTWWRNYLGGPVPLLSVAAEGLCFAGVTWAVVRAPTPRLMRGPERWYPVAVAGWTVCATTAFVLTTRPRWIGLPPATWWPAGAPDHHLSTYVIRVYAVGGVLLSAGVAGVLLARRRRTDGIDSGEVVPLLAATVLAGVVEVGILVAGVLTGGPPAADTRRLQIGATIVLVPLTFLFLQLRRRLARAALVGLVLDVAGPATPRSVTRSLRAALGDPGLEVFFWHPDQGRYVDAQGAAITAPAATTDRFLVPVTARDHTPLALMVADRGLQRRPFLVDAAVAASALSLENARLQAIVLGQLEQVRASSRRIIDAGQATRRRLRGELRDGTERRLEGVVAAVGVVRAELGGDTSRDPAVIDLLDRIREQLDLAFADLRGLMLGIPPAVLAAGGLRPALEEVAARLPLDVGLRVTAARYDRPVETTAYFVANEALANIAKHARASTVELDVHGSGDTLSIRIRDDGVGGARVAPGGGLAGLVERVRDVGGEVAVVSPPGEGTLMTARIPCG